MDENKTPEKKQVSHESGGAKGGAEGGEAPKRPRRRGGRNRGGRNSNRPRPEGGENRAAEGAGAEKRESGSGGRRGGGRTQASTKPAGAPRGNRKRHSSGDPMAGGIDENGVGWYGRMRDGIDANKRSQEDRLRTFENFGDKEHSVRFVPLGGLDQIGGNIAVLETEESAIIIDVGMSFPTPDMHGVDILVPDFSYLHAIKEKIKGIVITHAHEDHIGAVPYLFKEMQVPIYGTSLPLAMIGAKFDEHKLIEHKRFFRFVEKRKPVMIGDFEVEWIHMTHSVLDACSLAITTAAGTLIHTGDFKLDNCPVDGFPPDYHRLAHYGERGVLALLSDSTNSYNPGFTKSESVVGKTFDDLFSKSKGRILMSTFSSNTHRIAQAIESAKKFGRKVAIIGRSMEKNINLARELEYIHVDEKMVIDAHEVARLPDNQVLIITTGSQGESQAALFRMSMNEHRHIKIKPTDTVVISAKAIPGNENSVNTVINQILKSGAKVAFHEFSEIHASGHAAQEEQKLMIRLTKPKYFIPVHGEYQHLLRHRQTATTVGIPERNVAIIEDGEQMEISHKGIRKVRSVRCGKTFIDNQFNKEVETSVVFDRQNLSQEGVVMMILQIDKQNQALIDKPKVTTLGLVGQKKEHAFARELEGVVKAFISGIKPEDYGNIRALENSLRQALKKHIYRVLKRYPIIVPNIFVQ